MTRCQRAPRNPRADVHALFHNPCRRSRRRIAADRARRLANDRLRRGGRRRSLPRFRSLQGAVADAARFHAWLCDADGGGLALEDSRLVLSKPNPVSRLQDEVDEQLLEIVTAARIPRRAR
jgi:hypothetical protein